MSLNNVIASVVRQIDVYRPIKIQKSYGPTVFFNVIAAFGFTVLNVCFLYGCVTIFMFILMTLHKHRFAIKEKLDDPVIYLKGCFREKTYE